MKPLLIVKVGETFRDFARQHGDFDRWISEGVGSMRMPVNVVDPRQDAALPAPSDIAGAIVTGSHSMVTDRPQWSEAVALWLRKMVMFKVPVLGICYGHQLLAQALGGYVGYHPEGIEIGTVSVRRADLPVDDPLFGNLPCEFAAQVVHRQSVRRLPHGAVLLAGNPFEPHQAFRIGAAAWGVQFHPEFSSTAMSRYIEHLAGDLETNGRDVKSLLAKVGPAESAAMVLRNFGVFVNGHSHQPA